MKVKGRGEKNIALFIDWVKETFPQVTNVASVETAEELVRGSDLVAYCSSGATGDPSTYPTVERDWIKPGAFLAMPALGNFDAGGVAGGPDVRKVLDYTGLYEAWVSEVPHPTHNHIPLVGMRFMDMVTEGTLKREALEDLSAIVAGSAPGRTNDDEIIMLSVGGMPVEDVAWGTIVYRNAIEKGIGVSLNLWKEPILR